MMKNFMLVDNWNDAKEKIIKGSVNIVPLCGRQGSLRV